MFFLATVSFFLIIALHCPRAARVVYVLCCLRQLQIQVRLLLTYAMRYIHVSMRYIHSIKQAVSLPPVLHVREASPQITTNRGRVNMKIKKIIKKLRKE